jgi:hypothetical protein
MRGLTLRGLGGPTQLLLTQQYEEEWGLAGASPVEESKCCRRCRLRIAWLGQRIIAEHPYLASAPHPCRGQSFVGRSLRQARRLLELQDKKVDSACQHRPGR